jgi:hypothetical protein
VRSVVGHLPGDNPAKDISNELMALGFGVVSVRQMTASRPQPQGGTQIVDLPLFLVTPTRNEKSAEIFKLTSLRDMVIKVEAYGAQNGLMQCYNCQKFGKEFHEKGKEESTPNCCNCKLGWGRVGG